MSRRYYPSAPYPTKQSDQGEKVDLKVSSADKDNQAESEGTNLQENNSNMNPDHGDDSEVRTDGLSETDQPTSGENQSNSTKQPVNKGEDESKTEETKDQTRKQEESEANLSENRRQLSTKHNSELDASTYGAPTPDDNLMNSSEKDQKLLDHKEIDDSQNKVKDRKENIPLDVQKSKDEEVSQLCENECANTEVIFNEYKEVPCGSGIPNTNTVTDKSASYPTKQSDQGEKVELKVSSADKDNQAQSEGTNLQENNSNMNPDHGDDSEVKTDGLSETDQPTSGENQSNSTKQPVNKGEDESKTEETKDQTRKQEESEANLSKNIRQLSTKHNSELDASTYGAPTPDDNLMNSSEKDQKLLDHKETDDSQNKVKDRKENIPLDVQKSKDEEVSQLCENECANTEVIFNEYKEVPCGSGIPNTNTVTDKSAPYPTKQSDQGEKVELKVSSADKDNQAESEGTNLQENNSNMNPDHGDDSEVKTDGLSETDQPTSGENQSNSTKQPVNKGEDESKTEETKDQTRKQEESEANLSENRRQLSTKHNSELDASTYGAPTPDDNLMNSSEKDQKLIDHKETDDSQNKVKDRKENIPLDVQKSKDEEVSQLCENECANTEVIFNEYKEVPCGSDIPNTNTVTDKIRTDDLQLGPQIQGSEIKDKAYDRETEEKEEVIQYPIKEHDQSRSRDTINGGVKEGPMYQIVREIVNENIVSIEDKVVNIFKEMSAPYPTKQSDQGEKVELNVCSADKDNQAESEGTNLQENNSNMNPDHGDDSEVKTDGLSETDQPTSGENQSNSTKQPVNKGEDESKTEETKDQTRKQEESEDNLLENRRQLSTKHNSELNANTYGELTPDDNLMNSSEKDQKLLDHKETDDSQNKVKDRKENIPLDVQKLKDEEVSQLCENECANTEVIFNEYKEVPCGSGIPNTNTVTDKIRTDDLQLSPQIQGSGIKDKAYDRETEEKEEVIQYPIKEHDQSRSRDTINGGVIEGPMYQIVREIVNENIISIEDKVVNIFKEMIELQRDSLSSIMKSVQILVKNEINKISEYAIKYSDAEPDLEKPNAISEGQIESQIMTISESIDEYDVEPLEDDKPPENETYPRTDVMPFQLPDSILYNEVEVKSHGAENQESILIRVPMLNTVQVHHSLGETLDEKETSALKSDQETIVQNDTSKIDTVAIICKEQIQSGDDNESNEQPKNETIEEEKSVEETNDITNEDVNVEASIIDDVSTKEPLRFHSVHGTNIQLSNNGFRAQRKNSFIFYGQGITFSSRPVALQEKIYIQLEEVSDHKVGCLTFGFTNNDPYTIAGKLPSVVITDLEKKPGYWAGHLAKPFCRRNNVFHYYLNSTGTVSYGINGIDKGNLLWSVDTTAPLWAMIEIFGHFTAVKLIDYSRLSGKCSSENKDTSVNIMTPVSKLLIPSLQYQRSIRLMPLKLHTTIGKNVRILEFKGVAARSDCLANQGYVFTNSPMRPGQTIVIQILCTGPGYEFLPLGLTCCDPTILEPSDLPDSVEALAQWGQNWVVFKNVANFVRAGDELAVTRTLNGDIRVRKNNGEPITLMRVDRKLRFWMFLEMYGAIRMVRMWTTIRQNDRIFMLRKSISRETI